MARQCQRCSKRCYSEFCFNCKPKKPINPIGKRAKKNAETTKIFKDSLVPNSFGKYECYLQISDWCPRFLDLDQVVPEHVKPKGSHASLRDDQSNIWVSCSGCNSVKGSRSLESLSTEYPHLKKYLLTNN